MPLTSASDISIVLSGGTVNLDPNASLGGDPSSTPVTNDTLNNLFSDVTSDESTAGYIDYRCVYLFNDGQTPIYSIQLWIEENDPSGSIIQLGVDMSNETQRITISGATVTGGSFTLGYKGQTFTTQYNSDTGGWATNILQNLLALKDGNGNNFFHSVAVNASNVGSNTIIFDVSFSGLDASRSFDLFTVVANNLQPSGQVNVFVTTPQVGSPINTIAPEINLPTTPPGGVGFVAASQIAPIFLPVLNPNEGFPLWVQRTTAAGTAAMQNDSFVLSFRAESLAP